MTLRNDAPRFAPMVGDSWTITSCRWVCQVLLLVLLLYPPTPGRAENFSTIDPSGQWKSLHGVLSLMLSGDALSFSYSAVFGATAHMCDGVSVAGLFTNGEYRYVDEQGTVAFKVDEEGVKMLTIGGIASFCGAYWPGDTFTRSGYQAPTRCTVSSPKAHFYVAKPPPPIERKGYLLKGDRVEVVSTCFEGGDPYVFARFKGPKATTVGLLRKDALDCLE